MYINHCFIMAGEQNATENLTLFLNQFCAKAGQEKRNWLKKYRSCHRLEWTTGAALRHARHKAD